MIRRMKHASKSKNNSGSSFVLVIVATTFMCVLASAILMGAMMTYKLKYYKLNSINNFYEVEKALDEIYAGVGATVNEHLYSAYTTTAELVVTYDTNNDVYTTLDNDSANVLFKKLFMSGFLSNSDYQTLDGVGDTFSSYISNLYSATNKDGVAFDVNELKLVFEDSQGRQYTQWYEPNVSTGKYSYKETKDNGYDSGDVVSIAFKNVCLKREVEVSGTDTDKSGGKYVQSITTDIVLTQPEYNVSFSTYNGSSDKLFNYAMLADMGVEITSPDTSTESTGTSVTINGNIYTASDYYNKSYNGDEDTKVTTKYDTTASIAWGSTDKSVYSGLFVDGENSKLVMNSDVIICAGTLAAYNGAKIQVMGRTQNKSELWTDSIVIGGSEKGGSITATADAYVYDDTELNAEESSLTFNDGRYFGYSYSAKDTRDISFLKEKGLASNFQLRSHFSDSAIIVNGKNSKLDLENLTSLYIAGKSYIEFSKVTVDSTSDDEEDAEEDNTERYEYTTLKDYSTGQSLDVKSNQLMFLTQWEVTESSDDDNKVTLKVPQYVGTDAKIKELYEKYIVDKDGNDSIYAIKQEISGHKYYYIYIDDDKDADGNITKTKEEKAEEFAKLYYSILDPTAETQNSNVYNVRKYSNFEVDLLLPDNDSETGSKIAAGGLVTDQDSTNDWLYFREEADTSLNVYNALKSAATEKTFSTLLSGTGQALGNSDAQDAIEKIKDEKASENTVDYDGEDTKKTASNLLAYMYINLKDHLSAADDTREVVNVASNETTTETTTEPISAWEKAGYSSTQGGYTYSYDADSDKYSFDYSITPLTSYVNFKYIMSKNVQVDEVVDGARVIIAGRGTGDVTVSDKADGTGEVKGIIIATGNVTFDPSVTKFTGIIITGGKIVIDHTMTFTADNAMVSSLLSKCAKSSNSKINQLTNNQGTTGSNDKVFINYKIVESDGSAKDDDGMTISDISYEDILTFENWKKNVE